MKDMKRRILLISIITVAVILVCLLAAGGFVLLRLSSQSKTLEAADSFLSNQQPAEALSAYASLLKEEPLPIVSLEETNIRLAESGVLRSADLLLSDDAAAKQLIETDALNTIYAEATHPSVSESFLEDLKIRIRYTDLLKAGSSQTVGTDPASPYSAALSGFMAALVSQGAVISRDKRLEVQVWQAYDSFLLDDAKQIAAEISDESAQDFHPHRHRREMGSASGSSP